MKHEENFCYTGSRLGNVLGESMKKSDLEFQSKDAYLEPDGSVKLFMELCADNGCPSLSYNRIYPQRYTGASGKEKGDDLGKILQKTLMIHFGNRGIQFGNREACIRDSEEVGEFREMEDSTNKLMIEYMTYRIPKEEYVTKANDTENRKKDLERRLGIKEYINFTFANGDSIDVIKNNNPIHNSTRLAYGSEGSLETIKKAMKESGYKRFEELKYFLSEEAEREFEVKKTVSLPSADRFMRIIVPYWEKGYA